jgi:dolichol-phosphate mannosyltransferase
MTATLRKDTAPLAEILIQTPFSVVIPTYQEAENIPLMLERFAALRGQLQAPFEVLFLDDNSQDGSVEAVAASGYDWARIIVRTENRGLSPAVIEGFEAAQYPVLICMDCDLSHPVERIPALILALSAGQQMAIGSRYVPGGSTDDDWGPFRWLNSRVATMLARPLTTAKDPMSGFFALRRADFLAAQRLNPVGYKIALELIVKCGFQNVAEVPIAFTDRQHGTSKLTLKEQLKYIQHLRRLYIHKFGEAMHLAQFLVVGASGVFVNLAVLSLLRLLGAQVPVAIAGGIAVSLVSNFLLNRRFSFSYARSRSVWGQFFGFLGASALGIVVNYLVALYAANNLISPANPFGVQLAALLGIISGMAFNFMGNRFFVFKKKHVRDNADTVNLQE